MLYALDPEGQKIQAAPGLEATCPLCGETLIPKCGSIVVWHWAHRTLADCDPWWEPESPWHREWKTLVKPQFCEVVLGQHRADILGNGKVVIELQRSYISAEEIQSREAFYGWMFWVFDGTEAFRAGRLEITDRGNHITFRWRHPRRSLYHCRAPVFVDLGDSLLRIRKLHGGRCAGWGYRLSYKQFIRHHLSEVVEETASSP